MIQTARICIQVTAALHMRDILGIDRKIYNRKSISRSTTNRQSWNLWAKLTGETLEG